MEDHSSEEEFEQQLEHDMAEDNTYFETLIAEENSRNEEEAKELESVLSEKVPEFELILDTLREFFSSPDWQKKNMKWMELYDSNFKFVASVDCKYRDNNIKLLETCMGKLLEFSKGRDEEQRKHIYRIFSYWMRVPSFLLGKYEDVKANFFNLTQ